MEHSKLGYIDALRGWAILGVVAVHVSQQVTAIPAPWSIWLANGSRGVQLFFLASAITLLISWRTRHDGAANFYLRRLFRIAPLFWLAAIAYGLINQSSLGQVLATIFFVNGFHPDTIMGVVPGGWSIVVEMSFYLCFPLLAAFIRSFWAALAFLALATLASLFLDAASLELWAAQVPAISGDAINNFTARWFFHQLPVFALGFATWFAITRFPWRGVYPWLEAILVASLAGLALAALCVNTFFLPLFFAPAIYALANGAGRYLTTAPIRNLGRISFGLYLWHFFVIDRLTAFIPPQDWALHVVTFYAATLAFGTALATLTYFAIERPMVRLGNRLIARRKTPAIAPAATSAPART